MVHRRLPGRRPHWNLRSVQVTPNQKLSGQAFWEIEFPGVQPCDAGWFFTGEMELSCHQTENPAYSAMSWRGLSNLCRGAIIYIIFCVSSQRLKNRPGSDLRFPSSACGFWKQPLKNSEMHRDTSLTYQQLWDYALSWPSRKRTPPLQVFLTAIEMECGEEVEPDNKLFVS